jgi:hypothetical protein
MALIFVPLLAATCLYSVFLWWYSSHVFVVVVEETAAGNQQTEWSDEPYHDWLWQGLYLAYMVAIWVVPAFLVARVASPHVAENWRPYLFALFAFALFWIGFPIALLSSMSAESRWVIFHPGLFQRLMKCATHVLIFYALSGVAVAICIPLAPWMVSDDSFFSIALGGFGIGFALVLYARMMGRLAFIARLTYIRPPKPKKARIKRLKKKHVVVTDPWDVPEDVRAEMEATGAGFIQPEDLPPLQTPYEGDVVGYNVAFADVPKPVEPSRKKMDLEEALPTAADARADELDTDERRRRLAQIEPDKLEMARANNPKEKIPEHPWRNGIWLFPFSHGTNIHWVVVSGGLLILGVLIRALRATWPW